jgi:hypothetical protein
MALRKPAVLALVVWTFLVWTVRLGNVWRDSEMSTAGKIGRTAVILVLTALLVALVAHMFRGALTAGRRAVRLLALATMFIWVQRLLTIVVFGEHDASFKTVHAIIGVISIVLAYLALRSVADREPEAIAPV